MAMAGMLDVIFVANKHFFSKGDKYELSCTYLQIVSWEEYVLR